MKRLPLLLLTLLTTSGAWAHGHPAPIDDSMPDAQKIRFCERVVTMPCRLSTIATVAAR